MKIWIKPYLRKNGELMIYISGSNKCSVGLSETYEKGMTNGKKERSCRGT